MCALLRRPLIEGPDDPTPSPATADDAAPGEPFHDGPVEDETVATTARRRSVLAAVAVLALVIGGVWITLQLVVGPTERLGPPPEQVARLAEEDLTAVRCGPGFTATTLDQTVRLGVAGPLAPRVGEWRLGDGLWEGTVELGRNLDESDCDGDDGSLLPTRGPRVEDAYPLDGLIRIDEVPPSSTGCRAVIAHLEQLVVDVDGTRVELDDLAIRNSLYGCFGN